MTSLADHHSTSIVKLLLLGDAKVGKTGSLISLVNAGYKLRILDFDNLLDYFYQLVKEQCPDKLDNVEYRTLRDPIKAGREGPVYDGKPTAWIDAIRMLDDWKYDDVNLGDPSKWGPDCILVIDSLSRMCDAAYAFHVSIDKNQDGRAVYHNAQRNVEKILGMLTAGSFNTNLIITSHGMIMEMDDKKKKIYPYGVGEKLSPKIPSYFPNYIRYNLDINGKRTIELEGDNMIALSVGRQFNRKDLPISTGLADFFAAFREPPGKNTTHPKVLTLQRKA
jgi:hypothetical protein